MPPASLIGYGEMEKQWEVGFHGDFAREFGAWSEEVQDATLSVLGKLRAFGPSLGRPSVDTLKGSEYPNMKELRIQHSGRPYRVLFAFDPRRCAILLIGGDKTGNDRWYEEFVPIADALYDRHLQTLKKEGK